MIHVKNPYFFHFDFDFTSYVYYNTCSVQTIESTAKLTTIIIGALHAYINYL